MVNSYLSHSKMIQNYKKTFFLFFITSNIMKAICYIFKVKDNIEGKEKIFNFFIAML